MAYTIDCLECPEKTWVRDIVQLLAHHRDPSSGRLKCSHCGALRGRIEQRAKLQEGGTWTYWIHGVVPLPSADEYYRPYMRVVSEDPRHDGNMAQLCYYKDLRGEGGNLKHGHGPGAPPVLGESALLEMIARLLSLGVISADRFRAVIEGR